MAQCGIFSYFRLFPLKFLNYSGIFSFWLRIENPFDTEMLVLFILAIILLLYLWLLLLFHLLCLFKKKSVFVDWITFLSFFWDLMSDLIYLLFSENLIWLNSDLDVEALREDSLHLLAFCFWCSSLASIVLVLIYQKFSIFCDLFLIFLSTLFQYINICIPGPLE